MLTEFLFKVIIIQSERERERERAVIKKQQKACSIVTIIEAKYKNKQ